MTVLHSDRLNGQQKWSLFSQIHLYAHDKCETAENMDMMVWIQGIGTFHIS